MADYSMLIAVVARLAVLGACVGLGVAMSRAHDGEPAKGGGSAFGDDRDPDDDAQGGLWG